MWSPSRRKKSSWLFGVLFVAKLACLCLALSVVFQGGGEKHDYPTCDNCHCIPDEGEPCPFDRMSADASSTNATKRGQLIQNLRAIRHANPLELECDPYRNSSCATVPAQESEGGACVVDYAFEHIDACPVSYRLRTYKGSIHDAREEGLLVTHAGACGVCSSLQDLAAYVEQGAGLRHASTVCGMRGRVSEADGVRCFREIGFTDSCSQVWFFNTRNTAEHCMSKCVPFVLSGRPPNQNLPGCPLDSCIECDEVQSGPLFKRFAGRSRRNSGLQSSIVRRCSEMEELELHDPCDQITSPSSTLLSASSEYPELVHYVEDEKAPHALKVESTVLRSTNVRY
jgi:hypothetical protein